MREPPSASAVPLSTVKPLSALSNPRETFEVPAREVCSDIAGRRTAPTLATDASLNTSPSPSLVSAPSATPASPPLPASIPLASHSPAGQAKANPPSIFCPISFGSNLDLSEEPLQRDSSEREQIRARFALAVARAIKLHCLAAHRRQEEEEREREMERKEAGAGSLSREREPFVFKLDFPQDCFV